MRHDNLGQGSVKIMTEQLKNWAVYLLPGCMHSGASLLILVAFSHPAWSDWCFVISHWKYIPPVLCGSYSPFSAKVKHHVLTCIYRSSNKLVTPCPGCGSVFLNPSSTWSVFSPLGTFPLFHFLPMQLWTSAMTFNDPDRQWRMPTPGCQKSQEYSCAAVCPQTSFLAMLSSSSSFM